MKMIRQCKCKDWKENAPILDSALSFVATRNFGGPGLKKIFSYCPWCGKKLDEVQDE